MQITIKQKPFGYFKITPYLVFIDGELVGKVYRFRPLTLDVGKEEFNLTLKDNFFKSSRHCSVRDGDTILFDTIDNFPMCLYVLYDLILILLMFLHVNLFLPFGAIIATILLFPAFIYAFALINRNHYFVIDNVESHNAGLSEDLRRLRDYLEKNPGASAQQVADDLHFSLRTAQRRLAELKKNKE